MYMVHYTHMDTYAHTSKCVYVHTYTTRYMYRSFAINLAVALATYSDYSLPYPKCLFSKGAYFRENNMVI